MEVGRVEVGRVEGCVFVLALHYLLHFGGVTQWARRE